MKISTKGRYALRLLLDLAQHQHQGYVSLKDIAQRQNISKKYLEHIVSILSKANCLKTTRGYQGGYRLSKAPNQYNVADILRITEGNIGPVTCLDSEENICERKDECITLYVWEGLYDVVHEYLSNITLEDILAKKGLSDDDYSI